MVKVSSTAGRMPVRSSWKGPLLLVLVCLNIMQTMSGSREPLEAVALIRKQCALSSKRPFVRSGVPNTTKCLAAPFPCLGQDFGCVSWNARGLFCVDPILRDAKILELHSLCRKFCIVCLQETHGTEASALLQSSGILRSHVFLPSGFMRDGQFCGDAGGVGILVDEGLFLKCDDGSLLPLSSTPVVIALNLVKVHVPGRCMSIRVWDSRGAKSCVVYNTHNFGLSGMEMSRIERALMTDMATIRIDMTNSSLVILISILRMSPRSR